MAPSRNALTTRGSAVSCSGPLNFHVIGTGHPFVSWKYRVTLFRFRYVVTRVAWTSLRAPDVNLGRTSSFRVASTSHGRLRTAVSILRCLEPPRAAAAAAAAIAIATNSGETCPIFLFCLLICFSALIKFVAPVLLICSLNYLLNIQGRCCLNL